MSTYFHTIEPSENLAQAVANAQHNDLNNLFGLLGCPAAELLVTPDSTRAALLGAQVGRGFFAHELRHRIPMPAGLEPEVDVWDDGTIPIWRAGILTEPKYFSFFQDSPHAAYNPNYRHQWRAHELLHGAVGFFFREDMTRFEFYLASRLNELLPVVHWYGLDEAFRHRCDAHQDETYIREYCGECERLAFEPLAKTPATVERAARFIELAKTHFETELALCKQELESGRPHGNPIAHIDASSDSMGYLHGHWPRCTAWSFGYWVERFLAPQVDYETTCLGLLEKVSRTFDQLLSGNITVDEKAAKRLHARRRLQDLAYRTLLVIEGLPEDQSTDVETSLEDGLAILEAACSDLLFRDAKGNPFAEFRAQLDEHLPDHSDIIFSTGFEHTESAINYIVEGITSGLPATAEYLGDKLSTVASVFVENPLFTTSQRLDQRFAEFLPDADEDATKLAEFEVWANAIVTPDQEAETFGVVPEEELPEPGTLRLNTTTRRKILPAYVMHHIFGMQRATEVLVIEMRGQTRFCVVDEITANILKAVDSDDITTLSGEEVETLFGIIEEGFVVWLPKPQKA